MTYFTSVTSTTDSPLRKLHLFWVCEPGKKGRNLRTWGYTKEEATTLKYNTSSLTASGSINKIGIISKGKNYQTIPVVTLSLIHI